MKYVKTEELYDLEKTIAKELFYNIEYPWDALSKIGEFIISLGTKLSKDNFLKISDNVWIAKTAKVANTASINGPCIIDENTEIRHSAYIRGNAIIGKNVVVGNSTEIKNSILFDNVQVPHFNYVGDSILGYKAHMGAGSVTSNVKSDKSLVCIKIDDEIIETNLKKVGAMLGDNVEIGCNSVLCPGTVVGRNTIIYPTRMVRGVIDSDVIYKSEHNISKRM